MSAINGVLIEMDEFLESKGARFVRSPEGAARFGVPIGTRIDASGKPIGAIVNPKKRVTKSAAKRINSRPDALAYDAPRTAAKKSSIRAAAARAANVEGRAAAKKVAKKAPYKSPMAGSGRNARSSAAYQDSKRTLDRVEKNGGDVTELRRTLERASDALISAALDGNTELIERRKKRMLQVAGRIADVVRTDQMNEGRTPAQKRSAMLERQRRQAGSSTPKPSPTPAKRLAPSTRQGTSSALPTVKDIDKLTVEMNASIRSLPNITEQRTAHRRAATINGQLERIRANMEHASRTGGATDTELADRADRLRKAYAKYEQLAAELRGTTPRSGVTS